MCLFTSHESDGIPEAASVGVFDGHYGEWAAAVSAQTLNHDVIRRYKRLSARLQTNEFTGLSSQEKADALFVESVRLSCAELDYNIRSQHSSGCTANCLFIMPSEEHDESRVYCTNIGDSRTILFTAVTDEQGHLNEFGLSSSEHSGSTVSLSRTDSDSSNLNNARQVKIFPCSEDHRLSLSRERLRIEGKVKPARQPLPADLVLCTFMTSPPFDIQEAEESSAGFLEFGYPPLDVLDMAEAFIKGIVEESDTLIESKMYRLRTDPVLVSDPRVVPSCSTGLKTPEEEFPRIIHSESFIARRSNTKGEKVGPEAIMGRYGLSIMMTRSIGDRYGPRCVSAEPDVSVVCIPDESFARFVTASDGVWDTLSNKQVRKIVKRIRDPNLAARKVAEHANRRRLAEGRYADDISVVVVDVNPSNFPMEWRRQSLRSCALQ